MSDFAVRLCTGNVFDSLGPAMESALSMYFTLTFGCCVSYERSIRQEFLIICRTLSPINVYMSISCRLCYMQDQFMTKPYLFTSCYQSYVGERCYSKLDWFKLGALFVCIACPNFSNIWHISVICIEHRLIALYLNIRLIIYKRNVTFNAKQNKNDLVWFVFNYWAFAKKSTFIPNVSVSVHAALPYTDRTFSRVLVVLD